MTVPEMAEVEGWSVLQVISSEFPPTETACKFEIVGTLGFTVNCWVTDCAAE